MNVQAEKDDNLEGLYKQLGISAEDFGKKYNITNMSTFEVVAGQTTFNITDFVFASNASVDPSSLLSNCHGFVSAAKGLIPSEGQVAQLNTSGMAQTNTPRTGDVAVFNMQGQYQYVGQPDPVNASGIQGHSAIYVVTYQAGEVQYINRINTGQPISVTTQGGIANYLSNPNNAYGGAKAYIILPSLSPDPILFRVK